MDERGEREREQGPRRKAEFENRICPEIGRIVDAVDVADKEQLKAEEQKQRGDKECEGEHVAAQPMAQRP